MEASEKGAAAAAGRDDFPHRPSELGRLRFEFAFAPFFLLPRSFA